MVRGTPSTAPTRPAKPKAAPVQNSTATGAWSMIKPPSGRPTDPPMAVIAPTSAIPTGTRRDGSASRTMPKLSGKMAPPSPWTARAATSSGRFCANAEATDANANTASTVISMRRRPYMSPIRPTSGVAGAATSVYAVKTQAVAPAEEWKCAWSTGSAGSSWVAASE